MLSERSDREYKKGRGMMVETAAPVLGLVALQ